MSGNVESDGYYSFESGIIHPSYGMVSISLNPDSQSSNVDFENKKITLSNFYFVVGVGSFGWKKDVFSW